MIILQREEKKKEKKTTNTFLMKIFIKHPQKNLGPEQQ